MKFSLRNLALAGAMTLAGVAMAQDAPFTVEKNWFKTYTGNSTNEYRFGTGWGGKVYMTDKTNGKINAFDANGVTNVAEHAVAVNLTHDDAGNFLFHPSWAANADCSKWTIWNPNTNEFTDVELTLPEDAVGARMDCVGRVIGDVLSEEGGLMVFAPNTGTKPYIIKIANGVQVTPDFTDYPVSESSPNTFDTTTLGQFTYTYEEVCDMGDDWANAIAVRKRGDLAPKWLVDGEWVKMPVASTAKSSEGFDVFVLGDKLYVVNPAGDVNYTSRFAITDAETGDVVYTSPVEDEVSTAAGQGFGSITANKVDDNTVEIYICGQTHATTGLTYTGMYTVKLPGGEEPTPEVPALYITGNCTTPNWSADSPEEMTYADGKYTYDFTDAAQFKISTKKGSWDEFNAGVIGIADDNTTENMELDKVYTLDASKIGNFGIAKKGTYTLTVDLEAKTAVLTGEVYKEPAPEALYLIGDLCGWNPANGVELVKDEEDNFFRAEAVEFSSSNETSYFCVFGQKDWGPLRLGPSNNGHLINDYDVVNMYTGMGDNAWQVAPGKYDVFVNWDNMTIALSPYEEPAPQFTVKYWTNFGEEMEPEGQIMMETEGSEGSEYFIYQDFMAGVFYFDITMGVRNMLIGCVVDENNEAVAYSEGVEIELDKDIPAMYEGGFFKVPGKGITEAMIKLKFTPEGDLAVNVEGTLVPNDDPVEEPTYADKAHFAYNVKHEGHVGGLYTIKFHATGDAAKAVLVLSEVDGTDTEDIEVELGKAVKGENTFTYDATDLPLKKNYTWSVRLHGYEVPEVKISEPVAYTEGTGRAGIVVFTDPAYPEVFGKVVVVPGSARNLYVYAADGTLEKKLDISGTNGFNQSGNANNSSPMDGKQRGNEAVFASWGDSSNGVVAYNVLTDEIYGVFEGTKDANGAITNEANEFVGSGTPCLAFQGKGEDTKLFTFDEDGFTNCLAMNPIGSGKTTNKAAENWGFKSALANTNVGMWPAEEGLFLTQVRGNGMDANVYSLAYLNIEEKDIMWTMRDAAVANGYDPDAAEGENAGINFCGSSAAGVCVNPAGDLLALSTYDGVEVYLLGWEENAMGTLLPTLEKYATVAYPGGRSTVRTNVQFDAANNLYVQQQGTKSFYTVTLAEKEPIALTAAHEQYTIANPTAVGNIAVDAAANTEAVYYNLNGVRVNGKLSAGVYVKVANGKAEKVIVK